MSIVVSTFEHSATVHAAQAEVVGAPDVKVKLSQSAVPRAVRFP